MLPRQKRRGGGQAGNKITNAIYHKLTEVVETMAVLIETQPLTDTTVLLVRAHRRRTGVEYFGMERVTNSIRLPFHSWECMH